MAQMHIQPGRASQSREFFGGTSPALLALQSVIAEIAPTNIPILLVGDSGTGKEMFARHIHDLSSRSGEPLVKIPCASMNAETLAAELAIDATAYQNGGRNSSG